MAKKTMLKILAAAILFAVSALSYISAADKKYEPIPLPDKMKGAWIATVENIDFPSKPGLSSEEQKKEYEDLLDVLEKAGINTVFMQVRPTSDTFWPSKLDSWSAYLTGEQGKKPEPYYDPLKFMIEETHKRGMSFHAWLNPYRVTNIMKFELSANSYAKKHPKAIVEYGGKKYYNPAKKEARDHNVEIITELLTKYDIDGIHFDDYFYPYPVHKNKKDIDFPDKADYDKYVKNGGKMSKADWRRDNVNKLIKQLHATVKKIRPGAAFGISPFGIWRNQSNEVPDASPTKGFQAYEKLYADTRKWIKNGWIDYIMPQLYWSYETKAAPYGILLDWWEQETQKYGNGKVKLYIGLALYKHSGKTKGWPDGELEKQIKDIENRTNVQGGVFFSAKYFLENKNREIEISQNFYKKQLSE